MAAAPTMFAMAPSATATRGAPQGPPLIMLPSAPQARPVARRSGVTASDVKDAAKDGFARGKASAQRGLETVRVAAQEEAIEGIRVAETIGEGSEYVHAILFAVVDDLTGGMQVGGEEDDETSGWRLDASLPIGLVERIAAVVMADDEAIYQGLKGGGRAGITIGLYGLTRQGLVKARAELGD